MKKCSTFFALVIIASSITFPIFSLQANSSQRAPVIVLETTLGDIGIEVYPDKAPLSANSFLEAADKGLFNHNQGAFYRVVHKGNDIHSPNIGVIQGGIIDPTQSLPLIGHETTRQTGLLHKDGTVSLARGKDSSGSGSTFFICIGDQPTLDYGGTRYLDGRGFAAFGTVIQGMDIVRRIQRMKTHAPATDNPYTQQRLVKPVTILRAYRK